MPFNISPFNPQTDHFFLTLRAYTNDPTSHFKQQALIHAITTLNPLDFYSCSPATSKTRLMYLVTQLANHRILQNNLFVVQHFLARSERANQTRHASLPNTTAFLLLTPDSSGLNLYQWALHFKKPELLHLIEDAQTNLMEQGISIQETTTASTQLMHHVEQLWQLHFNLLEWEYKTGLIQPSSYFKELEKLTKLRLSADDGTTPPEQSIIYLFYSHRNIRGHRLLSRLLQPGANPQKFHDFLSLLKQSHENGQLSSPEYQTLLTQSTHPGRSLLHELLYRQSPASDAKKDAKNLSIYLSEINHLYCSGQLPHKDYIALFTKENKAGYSAIHQGINAPHIQIANTFLRFLKHNPFFSNSDCNLLINYKSKISENPQPAAKRTPRRSHQDDNGYINKCLGDWRKDLSCLFQRNQEETTVPRLSERGSNSFYPVIVTETKQQDWVHTWTPTTSPGRLDTDKQVTSQVLNGPT